MLINLILVFLSLYILDFLDIIDYRQVIQQIPFMKATFQPKVEDPYLLAKVELEKREQILNEKIKNYEASQDILSNEIKQIDMEKQDIVRAREEIGNAWRALTNEMQRILTYDQKIEEIAVQIESLPPDVGVKSLEKHPDLMIIDILRKIDRRAADAGKLSITPGILMLMNPEQLARIQQMMLQPNLTN